MINISASDRNFLDSYLNGKSFIFTTLMDNFFAEMGENWFINLKKLGHDKNTLIISLDKKCDDYFKKRNIPSIFLDSSTVWEEDLITPEQRPNIGFENTFKKVSMISFLIKHYNLNVFLTHVDIIFLKDPVPKIHEEFKEYDVLVNNNRYPFIDILHKGRKQCNKENGYVELVKPYLNYPEEDFLKISKSVDDPISFDNKLEYATDFSFLCIKANEKTKKYIDLLQRDKLKIINKKNLYGFNNINVEYINDVNLKYKFLSNILFLNGFYFKYNNSQHKNIFKKLIDNAYTLHYNTLTFDKNIEWENFDARKKTKIEEMKKQNHWFL